MAKDLTAKDVLYALEYLGDALVRVPIRDGRAKWQMRKSGMTVKDGVAYEVRSNPAISSHQELSKQIIVWGRAA